MDNPGKLKFKITCGRQKLLAMFQKDTIVEVCCDEDGYKGSCYSARIIDSQGFDKFMVEYQTLKADDETSPLREEIPARWIRPYPPILSPILQFKLHEQVDAWYNEGWWAGAISRVLNGLQYKVFFSSSNEELAFGHSNLRRHQDWINGNWVVSSEGKSYCQSGVIKSTGLKLIIRLNARKENSTFTKGMKVEVRSDEKGYEGSWFSALIVDLIGNDKLLVEYQTLKTEDETRMLREVANTSDVRPCPPCLQRFYPYDMFEYVDAWYNEGWWVGQVCEVLVGLRYNIYFSTTNEKLQFEHSDLRPHREWTDGKWIVFSRNLSAAAKCTT